MKMQTEIKKEDDNENKDVEKAKGQHEKGNKYHDGDTASTEQGL